MLWVQPENHLVAALDGFVFAILILVVVATQKPLAPKPSEVMRHDRVVVLGVTIIEGSLQNTGKVPHPSTHAGKLSNTVATILTAQITICMAAEASVCVPSGRAISSRFFVIWVQSRRHHTLLSVSITMVTMSRQTADGRPQPSRQTIGDQGVEERQNVTHGYGTAQKASVAPVICDGGISVQGNPWNTSRK